MEKLLGKDYMALVKDKNGEVYGDSIIDEFTEKDLYYFSNMVRDYNMKYKIYYREDLSCYVLDFLNN